MHGMLEQNAVLSLAGVERRHGAKDVLSNIDLTVRSGELLALLGPSGSGKTTLLRLMAGLDAPDGGRVLLGGEDVSYLSARERRVGFVFQSYALFGHMSVFENVAFGLKVRPRRERPTRARLRARVDELLSLVQLNDLGERRPGQLSGGQRQRVALARALAIEPRVLLLDEPFGALDANVRTDLRRWLKRLHEQVSVTTVLVTHDQQEAFELADRIALLDGGRLEQVGSPAELYDHPRSAFVSAFLGAQRVRCQAKCGVVELLGHTIALREGDYSGSAEAFVRAEDIDVRSVIEDGIDATLLSSVKTGNTLRLEVQVGGHRLEARISGKVGPDLDVGARCHIAVKVLHVFPAREHAQATIQI